MCEWTKLYLQLIFVCPAFFDDLMYNFYHMPSTASHFPTNSSLIIVWFMCMCMHGGHAGILTVSVMWWNKISVCCFRYLTMSRKSNRLVTSVQRDDEIWTEEEVIELGLAGEEEYSDMQVIETVVPFAIEETAVVEEMAAVEETTAYEAANAFGGATAFEEMTELETAEALLAESTTTKSGRVRLQNSFMMMIVIILYELVKNAL